MKILLANLASPANPGDQAILRGSLKLLREYFSNPDITLVTRAISRRKEYEKLGCDVIASYPDVDEIGMDFGLKKFMALPRVLKSRAPLREAVRRADFVFLAGGGYFYSNKRLFPGLTFYSHFTCINVAKEFGKPVIILPQSFGPAQAQIAKNMVRRGMKEASLVFYRENISGKWLEALCPDLKDRFVAMPDLALYLNPRDILAEDGALEARDRKVGVTVRPWEVESALLPRYLGSLARALVRLHSQTGRKIRIIVQVQDEKRMEGDEAVSQQLFETMAVALGQDQVELCTTHPYFDLPEICRLYRDCEFLISMRLHSAILAYLMGRPALVVGYQHKSEGVLQTLDLEHLYLGSFEQLDENAIVLAAEKMMQDQKTLEDKIRTSLDETRDRIRTIFWERMKVFGR
ncbi:MAG: polysaccharide pyruvyl transferase family protein [Candidatus Omnitrophota bacterium]|nr:polysaccharide pyruvyl transferase family protein [Candidatus Omnitrophota bacterium]